MHKLMLSPPVTVTDNPHFSDLLEGLEESSQSMGVYNTYVVSGPTHLEVFTFRTTTKDLHLKLGILTYECQVQLARMLEWHFANCIKESQLLLFFLFRGGKEGTILITRTKEQGEVIFTLAPAH